MGGAEIHYITGWTFLPCTFLPREGDPCSQQDCSALRGAVQKPHQCPMGPEATFPVSHQCISRFLNEAFFFFLHQKDGEGVMLAWL